MIILFLILIVIASVGLGFMVLVQNPKGGGLSGNVGGLSNQLMGVKQTTDVLEKGTWLFAAIIGILSITSTLFISKTTVAGPDNLEKVGGAPVQNNTPNPSNTIQMNQNTPNPDTPK